MLKRLQILHEFDPEVADAIESELYRQQNTIELIASENFTSPEVMLAQGTWLTNKYAEGLPGKRYYGGCEFVDVVEQLAIDRAKTLFGADHANVQPHSGAQANMAVYLAYLKPGDTIMGMNLAHGGHLTHGSHVNISGIYFNVVPYGVDRDSDRIDYDELEKLAKEKRPKMIVAGASAYPRFIDFERIGRIAKDIDAVFFVDMAHIAGLVAADQHPSPVPHADIVTTTTHKTLKGPRGGIILCKEQFAKAINKAVFPGIQGGPLMHVIAAKAVVLKEAMSPAYKVYQEQVVKNAHALAETLKSADFKLLTDGTDNHLVLLDLQKNNITGKEAEHWLEQIGITVNKNAVPFDPQSPFITSGIRVGTPAVTSRGFNTADLNTVGDLIATTLSNPDDIDVMAKSKETVRQLCEAHPLYPEYT